MSVFDVYYAGYEPANGFKFQNDQMTITVYIKVDMYSVFDVEEWSKVQVTYIHYTQGTFNMVIYRYNEDGRLTLKYTDPQANQILYFVFNLKNVPTELHAVLLYEQGKPAPLREQHGSPVYQNVLPSVPDGEEKTAGPPAQLRL